MQVRMLKIREEEEKRGGQDCYREECQELGENFLRNLPGEENEGNSVWFYRNAPLEFYIMTAENNCHGNSK